MPDVDDALVELERFDETWGAAYPPTVNAWRQSWEHVVPFLALPDELRRAVYTTNTIEGPHRQIRKAIKTRGHFPGRSAPDGRDHGILLGSDHRNSPGR